MEHILTLIPGKLANQKPVEPEPAKSLELPEYAEQFLRLSIRHNEEQAQKQLQEQRQQQLLALLEKSGLGKRFQQRTFATFVPNQDNQLVYEHCLSFATDFPNQQRGLMLVGGVGRGKTHLAAAIANHLLANYHPVIFGNITNIISLIHTTYSKNSQLTEEEMLKILTGTDLLVLDDLGKERDTNNTSSLVYQLINRSYEDNRLLVVTTNLTSEEMKQRLGDATFSRLIEMCKPLKLEGSDWRLKKWA